ncbi:L-ascorbate-6-phosphate lactonase UlaG [uncultured archaeon]|nr:L-ascorbate-6-phosphate lactonase UlaG [uncultured archaeon]
METIQLSIFVIFGIMTILLLVNLYIISGYSKINSAVPSFENNENSVIFVGHGTALIHMNNTNILTDPNFDDWIIMFHRIREAGLKIETLPKIDAVLISHAHRDHLDKWSMEQFPKGTPVLISKGNGDILRDRGFTDVRELDIWNETTIKGIKITATPAKHSGARNSATADYPLALSYVIEGNRTVYFAGDTGLSNSFEEIGNKYKIDVALLPIGAYKPRWFMKSHHMSPEDALDAMEMLGAKEMVPIHWGSFRMALDSTDEPKEVLLKLIENSSMKEKVHILENGEKYILK